MKTVLIVEDDSYIRDIYTRTFKDAGYAVDIAVDGEEGTTKAETNIYDVILLDIMLPKKNGLAVLRGLRADSSKSKDTPLFLLTNLGQDNVIAQAFELGADGYFIKAQINPDDVVKEVNTFLEQNQPLNPTT